MPQMSPMMWLYMYFFFLMMFLFFLTLIYFFSFPTMTPIEPKNPKFPYPWKW